MIFESFTVVTTSASTIGSITRHLLDWRAGDDAALSRLTDEIYRELRRLAGAVVGSHAGFPSLQPTELVHELYFKLPALQDIDWQGRAHFLNLAAQVMRRILIDCARRLQASKRGGTPVTLSLHAAAKDPALEVDVLLVHSALDRFAADHPRQAHVLELRFFGGLTTEETSEVLRASGHEASIRTVERDWTFAKAWMQNAIAVR
jgi:RNA polymerase sigma factor (TIGR02999 family)